MTSLISPPLSKWMTRHGVLVWLGIVLNLFFAVPLIFDPAWILGLFNVPPDESLWPRFAGLLVLIVTIFYIPPAMDVRRHRASAWIAVFPSRTLGAAFFFLAVFVFGQAPGFLIGVVLDGGIGLATLFCLIKITAIERAQGLA